MSMSISGFGTFCSGAYTHYLLFYFYASLFRGPTALRISFFFLVGLPAVPIYYYSILIDWKRDGDPNARLHPPIIWFFSRAATQNSTLFHERWSVIIMGRFEILFFAKFVQRFGTRQVCIHHVHGDLHPHTVGPLITHTPRWIAHAMSYGRLWVLRGRFGCKIWFCGGPNLWVMGVYRYGLWGVRLYSLCAGSTEIQWSSNPKR